MSKQNTKEKKFINMSPQLCSFIGCDQSKRIPKGNLILEIMKYVCDNNLKQNDEIILNSSIKGDILKRCLEIPQEKDKIYFDEIKFYVDKMANKYYIKKKTKI